MVQHVLQLLAVLEAQVALGFQLVLGFGQLALQLLALLGGLAHLAGDGLRLGLHFLAQLAAAGQPELGRPRAGGLRAVHAVVVPGFHVVFEAVAGLQVQRAQVPGIGVGAGALARQTQRRGALAAGGGTGLLPGAAQGVVQLQSGQAVVVAHGAAQCQEAPRHGVRKRLQREGGRQVGHGRELVGNRVAVEAGRVFQAQQVRLRAHDTPRGGEGAVVAAGGQRLVGVLEHQRQLIRRSRGKFPAHRAALGHRQVTAVRNGFGRPARVGRVGNVDLEIAQIGPFQHRELVFRRSKPRPLQLKRDVALRLLKRVAERIAAPGHLA